MSLPKKYRLTGKTLQAYVSDMYENARIDWWHEIRPDSPPSEIAVIHEYIVGDQEYAASVSRNERKSRGLDA